MKRKKNMKRVLKVFILFVVCFLLITNVDAASFSATSSTKTVKPYGTFTVSVGGDSIGRVNLSVSNGTLSTSSVWVEQNYQTVTVTAGSQGTVTITATPVTGFSDPDANLYNPGSRTITVTINSSTPETTTPSKPSSSTTSNKSKNDNLASLNLNVGALTPVFDASITEYSVNLSKETNKLTISAKPEDAKAKVSGLGEISLKPGLNKLLVVVTAENGNKKTYTISAFVDETPKIYLYYNDEKIGLVRTLDGVELKNFKTVDHVLNDENIVLFQNENLTFIYGQNERGDKNFYLFDKENETLTAKVLPTTIMNKDFYILDDQTLPDTITISGREMHCTKLHENYFVLSAIDIDKNIKEYIYETKEESMQLYNKDLFVGSTCTMSNGITNRMIFILSIALLISLVAPTLIYKRIKR